MLAAQTKTVDYGTPLRDRVLIRRVEPVKQIGSLILPDNAVEKSQEGVVVAIGEGTRTHEGLLPLTLRVGDHVLFGKYAGTEIGMHGEELSLMREDEVFMRLPNQGDR